VEGLRAAVTNVLNNVLPDGPLPRRIILRHPAESTAGFKAATLKRLVAEFPACKQVFIYDDDPACLVAYDDAGSDLSRTSQVCFRSEGVPTVPVPAFPLPLGERLKVKVFDSIISGAVHRHRRLPALCSDVEATLYAKGRLRTGQIVRAAKAAAEFVGEAWATVVMQLDPTFRAIYDGEAATSLLVQEFGSICFERIGFVAGFIFVSRCLLLLNLRLAALSYEQPCCFINH
jgi:hypothetical protein